MSPFNDWSLFSLAAMHCYTGGDSCGRFAGSQVFWSLLTLIYPPLYMQRTNSYQSTITTRICPTLAQYLRGSISAAPFANGPWQRLNAEKVSRRQGQNKHSAVVFGSRPTQIAQLCSSLPSPGQCHGKRPLNTRLAAGRQTMTI